MIKRIFTGNYATCKAGNLISISGDRGKSAGFEGKAMPVLAPKRKFWNVWHDNIGKIPQEENDRYYLEQYHKETLSKVDFEELLKDEKDPIFLCFEPPELFCHRTGLAAYLNLKYGVEVHEIEINEKLEVKENKMLTYVWDIMRDIVNKELEQNKEDERKEIER